MAPLSRVAVPLRPGWPARRRSIGQPIFRYSGRRWLLVVPGMLVCITNGATLIGILLGARWMRPRRSSPGSVSVA